MSQKNKMTLMQTEFCYEYIARRCNGKRAAMAVGCTETNAEVQASKWLRLPKVQKKIRELHRDHFKKLGCRAQDVLNELTTLGFSNLKDFITYDDNGIKIKTPEEIGENFKALKELKILSTTIRGKKEDSEDIITTETTIKLHDKIKPLENLLKHIMGPEEDEDDDDSKNVGLVLNAEDIQNKDASSLARDYSALLKSLRGSK